MTLQWKRGVARPCCHSTHHGLARFATSLRNYFSSRCGVVSGHRHLHAARWAVSGTGRVEPRHANPGHSRHHRSSHPCELPYRSRGHEKKSARAVSTQACARFCDWWYLPDSSQARAPQVYPASVGYTLGKCRSQDYRGVERFGRCLQWRLYSAPRYEFASQQHGWRNDLCKYPPAKPGALVCEPLKAA